MLIFLVRLLIALKQLLYGITITIVRPLFWLFKLLLSKPLIKLYYIIFKFKKSGLADNPWHVLAKQRALHIVVFLVTATIIVSNLINHNKNDNQGIKNANKTIISHLARNEFSAISDESELIEETSNLKRLLLAGNEKYENIASSLTNRHWVSNPEESDKDLAYYNNSLINRSYLSLNESETTSNSPTVAATRQEVVYYTVNQGDTISSIANKFQISINTILWSNNLTAFSLIRPGDKLTILPVSGTTYTVKSGDTVGKIALKFGVEENSIFKYNDIKSAGGLVIGKTIIIPGGKKLSETSVAKTNTGASKRNNGAAAVIEKLVNPSKAPASGAKMAWPTVGHRITQYYSWRHTGLDVANKIGTPLYAVESGTVEFSGWSNGYGNNVVVNHGGGKKTRYAHASKLFVKVGDKVDRGEQIANMGSTGWSTGSHIHFEVIVNGVKQNPLNYVK